VLVEIHMGPRDIEIQNAGGALGGGKASGCPYKNLEILGTKGRCSAEYSPFLPHLAPRCQSRSQPPFHLSNLPPTFLKYIWLILEWVFCSLHPHRPGAREDEIKTLFRAQTLPEKASLMPPLLLRL